MMGAPTWHARPPADEAAVAALERDLGVRLPDDYRDLLLRSDGGAIEGDRTAMNLEPVEVLGPHNRDDRFTRYIPGTFVFADNGGGSVYGIDLEGRFGRGEGAVFLFPLGELSGPTVVYGGSSVSDTAERILRGESIAPE
jgi:SMI1 / KNR4 family (SUKH-1)